MRFFYGRLRDEPDQSLALREAVLALRETNPHPYYWAPFVWIGKVASP
jgi:CHAT domain-containing protein